MSQPDAQYRQRQVNVRTVSCTRFHKESALSCCKGFGIGERNGAAVLEVRLAAHKHAKGAWATLLRLRKECRCRSRKTALVADVIRDEHSTSAIKQASELSIRGCGGTAVPEADLDGRRDARRVSEGCPIEGYCGGL